MNELLENIYSLRLGIFKDEKAVNDLLDDTKIKCYELKSKIDSLVDKAELFDEFSAFAHDEIEALKENSPE